VNILFYSPLQSRSKDTESIMEGFVKAGDGVFLLTQFKFSVYHEACLRIGVKCFASSIEGTEGILRKIQQVFYLIYFCNHHKIDVVYSQLEPANLIAVISQYFTRAKVVVVRHHIDEVEKTSSLKAYKVSIWIYKMARNVVVVSRRAKEYMVQWEGIKSSKISYIPLGYNFELWPKIDDDFVREKRKQLGSDLLLIAASRLVSGKRVDLAIQLLDMLLSGGIDCKLIVLGEGEDHEALKKLSISLGIEDRVSFEGYVTNVVDYIAVADFLVHFSLIDSSPAVVKEAGLALKPVIVCRDVGDCDDYIDDTINGFLVNRESPIPEAFKKIMECYSNPGHFNSVGFNLRNTVIKNFSIHSVLHKYQKLNKTLFSS